MFGQVFERISHGERIDGRVHYGRVDREERKMMSVCRFHTVSIDKGNRAELFAVDTVREPDPRCVPEWSANA
jgi:hypothetical protein